MSRDGTLIVTVPAEGASPTDAVAALLREAGDEPVLLDGVNHETVMGMFEDRSGWVKPDSADALTAEEATLVAARVAGRVAEGAGLEDTDRDALEATVRLRFVEAIEGTIPGEPEAWAAVVLEDAGAYLDPPQLEALEAALKAGVRPRDGED